MVLLLSMAIVTAAVVVIGLTALQVTGDGYRAPGAGDPLALARR